MNEISEDKIKVLFKNIKTKLDADPTEWKTRIEGLNDLEVNIINIKGAIKHWN